MIPNPKPARVKIRQRDLHKAQQLLEELLAGRRQPKIPARLRAMPWRRRKVAGQPWAEAVIQLAVAERRLPDEHYHLMRLARDNTVEFWYHWNEHSRERYDAVYPPTKE